MLQKIGCLLRGKKRNQAGITIVEISVGLAIIAFLAVFLGPRVAGLFSKTRVELASQEIIPLVVASQQYRQVNGGYADISFAALDTGGYHIEPFSEANTKNAYGKDVALTSGSSGAAAVLTYLTDEDSDCAQISKRIGALNPVTASCTGNSLVVTIN